ncbi:MAG: SpoIVB peptidase [Clostridiales bacterium]|nr:SpoIVB peptidase [Clostridiales bacterium]
MNLLKKILLIFCLLIILVYVTNITSIPSQIVLFEGEELNLGTVYGVTVKENNFQKQIVKTSNNLNNNETITLSLFNTIDVKDVKVDTIPRTTVVPLGNTIGLKLYTSGVLVVGLTEVNGIKPYENTGIEEGDLIVCVNGIDVTTTEELTECVDKSKGKKLEITYIKDGKEHTTNMTATKTSSNEYKLGLWVRDGAAGVGTISYYEPSTGMFAALGHGIVDVDTEELVTISKGTVVTTNVTEIVKGKEGTPGEIKGTIINGLEVGKVNDNSEFGIYGTLTNLSSLNINNQEQYEVALRDEIKEGKAEVIINLEDGARKKYEIEITKIYKNNNNDNKSMIIKVTDEELLNLTGGIIQGMSGAPIVQNGKFIGAVTHVLVSDPTTGYAVFGDLMVKQMRTAK